MKIRHYCADDAEALADLYARSVRRYGPRSYIDAQVVAWASTASASRIAARNVDGRLVAVAVDGAGISWVGVILKPTGILIFSMQHRKRKG